LWWVDNSLLLWTITMWLRLQVIPPASCGWWRQLAVLLARAALSVRRGRQLRRTSGNMMIVVTFAKQTHHRYRDP
jgi:hypothetical protein